MRERDAILRHVNRCGLANNRRADDAIESLRVEMDEVARLRALLRALLRNLDERDLRRREECEVRRGGDDRVRRGHDNQQVQVAL